MSVNQTKVAERAVESSAALCLGGAVAIAIFQLLPLASGFLALAALAGGVAAGVAAFALVASIAPRDFAMPGFNPAALAEDDDDVLLLDRFLGSEAGASRRGERRDGVGPDASAALHSALAEIRHSLSRA